MQKQRRNLTFVVLFVLILVIFTPLAYFFPPVHDRLAWRVDDLRVRIYQYFNPPEKVSFSGGKVTPATLAPLPPTSTPTPKPTSTVTRPADTPLPTPTPTITPTPLPASVILHSDTFRYQDQHGLWNYCSPANEAMALSWWGWKGDRLDAGAGLKPYEKDLNVMPYEMVDFANQQDGIGAISRVAGDLDMVKRLLVAGFPVVTERGVVFEYPPGTWTWMGHYLTITGYDDAQNSFISEDSFLIPGKDRPISYEDFNQGWRAMNYTYIVIYPKERESEVMAVLGPQADETANYRYALDLATTEINSGLDANNTFFAWYNRGTNLVKLQDYTGAAQAYDQAFAIYDTIPPEKYPPFRMLWYQTGPYFAYYYTGQYQRILDLAEAAMKVRRDPEGTAPEETLYWRGMAKLALGDREGAIDDFRTSINPFHPGFQPSIDELNALGVGEK